MTMMCSFKTNNAIVHNDQNDAFSEALIDVYIVEVSNSKGRIYSQPYNSYQLKQYRISSQPLFCLFILVYFFILLKAISESALEKLRQETKEKELERKVEAFKREQIKEKMKHVRLIGTIFVELLTLCVPIAKDTKFFEQE